MSYFAFRAEGRVAELDYQKYKYTVLQFADGVLDQPELAKSPLRIAGEVDEYPLNGAILNSRSMGRYVILSPELLKLAGFSVGDTLELRFNIADPEAVEIPSELDEALGATPMALAVWKGLTAGKRRGLAYLVGKPKSSAVRLRKAQEICDSLASGGRLPGSR